MPLDYSVTSNFADLNPLCSTLLSNGAECCLLWHFGHEQKLGTNKLKEIEIVLVYNQNVWHCDIVLSDTSWQVC